MGWSCAYCTLINDDNFPLCDGCGSQKEPVQLSRGFRSGLKNAVSGAVAALSTMIDDVVGAARDTSSQFYPQPSFVPPQPSPYNVFEVPQSPPHSAASPTSPTIPVITLSDSPSRPNDVSAESSILSYGDTSFNQSINRPSSSYKSSPMRKQGQKDEKEALEKRRKIEKLCRELSTSFVDDEFPPNEKSIGKLYHDADTAIPGRLQLSSITWLRPTEMYTKDGHRYPWSVFNDPTSCDIEQGALGDCWLLSALALIAERPDVLEKIFITKTYNSMGIYQIRLCVDGHWRVVTVDDYFPCRKQSRSLAFAVGRKNQLWVPLIEKAYAKALGKYENLRAGRTVEGLALLTGAACESINLDEEDIDLDLIWARLLSAKEAGYIMGSSCGAGSKQKVAPEVSSSLGLLTHHAYSILDVRQEDNHRLLGVRNPWGSHVWKGAWSDGWKEWPDHIKKRLLPTGKSPEGAFWMSFDDFILHFDSVDIAKIRGHLQWEEMRVPCQIGGSWADDAVAVMLVVEESTEVCCSLFRGGSRSGNDHEDLMICIHSINPRGHIGELQMRSPRSLSHMVTTGDFFLKSGHYVITSFSLSSFNRGTFRLDCTIVMHSNKLLFAEPISCPPQMSTDSLVQLCLKEGKQQKSINGIIPRYVTRRFAGLMVMVDNALPNTHVHISADCSSSTNVLSSRGSLRIIDSIPPMSRQIILILSHFDASNGYCVENRLMMRTSRSATMTDWNIEGVDVGRLGGGDKEHIPSLNDEATRHLHAPRDIFY